MNTPSTQLTPRQRTLLSLGAAIVGLALLFVFEGMFDVFTMQIFKLCAINVILALSLNLINGFTGLFSLGQAGFMLLGAYTYAILTIPAASQKSIYQRYANGGIGFSIPELLSKPLGGFGLLLGVVFCLILAGFIAALFAFLIGLPVLKLKSDYLAIATLGFAEIIRAAVVYEGFGPLTNGSNLLYGFTSFASFNLSLGGTTLHLETVMPFLFSGICIAIILLLINSTYGRAFKAIRDDEIAAEAMGINLASHKRMSFIISSFFAGISGAMLAMYQASVQATTFKSSMTYEILLIVVIGGIGSVRGALVSALLVGLADQALYRAKQAGRNRAAMVAQLANLNPAPDSVPINNLVAIPGTPMAEKDKIDGFEFLRTIAAARITMPKSFVRLSAGREAMSDEMQAMCFFAGANSIFYCDKLLTTTNAGTNRDLDLFDKLGLRAI